MAEYLAYQCKKCKRHYMSTTRKNNKCTYCKSSMGELKMSGKPRIISEYIRRANAKHLYEGDFNAE